MIYLYIPGHSGFGNQLFMYAKAYALAEERDEDITIINLTTEDDNHPFMLERLKLDQRVKKIHRIDGLKNRYLKSLNYRFWDFYRQHIRNCDKIVEKEWSREYREYFYNGDSPNLYVEGYFESYRYFDQYQEKIKQQFVPVDGFQNEFVKQARECNSVALHIRGGDFIQLGRAIDKKYYFDAIKKMKEFIKDPKFFLVTMEPTVRDMIQEYFKDTDELVVVNISGADKDFQEWNVLCSCRNHIISNSTYSWWGAYLNGDNGVVITPSKKQYYAAEKEYSGKFEDFYKEKWISL